MTLQLSPQAAARELLARRAARVSLVDYARYIEVPGAPLGKSARWKSADDDDDEAEAFAPVETELAAHHVLTLEAIQRCLETPYGRLMIFEPPGSAKSTYGSVVAPTWAMGRWPGYKFIGASYGSDLARKLGRRARSIVRQRKFAALFQTGISSESAAADEWALDSGSEYMSGGILSGITGNRARGIVIDDPVKGRAEAESAVIRKRTIEAYEDDLKTRLMPGGSVIIIQTRWHEEDLAGSILPADYAGESGLIECRDGQTWEVICLQARAERTDDPLGRQVGEYLWPEWFGAQHWAQFERKPRTWASLFQQRPAPQEGDLFKREYLRFYGPTAEIKPPRREFLTVYGASDYAVTADGGDFTVHVVVGIDAEGRLWLLDLWRGQTASDVWIETFCDLVLKWRPMAWAEETGQIKASLGPFITKRQRARRAFVAREQFPTRGDKAVRSQSIRGMMALDGLYVPADAPWLEALMAELMTFPMGSHDDQVDALGLIGQLLDRMFMKKPAGDGKTKPATGYQPASGASAPGDWQTY